MRIDRLDLLRYGLFTDRSIALPRAARDFHLIVGPNEAGKSTIRNAILDLLFGIEERSSYNFLHPHSQMRLGARIEHEGARLDFQRTKGRKRTLFGPDDAVLPDGALSALLGPIERAFFDQMFGLDHERLVEGGNEILSASNDVGRLLFQAASGVGGLREVREALEAEADGLWARKKSGTRAYYVAAEELASAEAELKQVTVRTRDWVAAKALVDNLTEQLDTTRARYRNLEGERVRLERIRRVAPTLDELLEKERELSALGDVIELPVDAASSLAQAERELSMAEQEKKLHAERLAAKRDELALLVVDEPALKALADIEALNARRQQVRNHESDIGKRQLEINGHWQTIESLVKQLGWPLEDEATLQRRLPPFPARQALASLAKREEVLEQAQASAEDALREKKGELASVEQAIGALPSTSVPASLRSALDAARNLGAVNAQRQRLQVQLARAERELKAAKGALGPWDTAVEALRALELPTIDEIESFRSRLAAYESSSANLKGLLDDVRSKINEQDLAVAQHRERHHAVTLDELKEARASRDGVWTSIKSGGVPLEEAAPGYEDKVRAADDVSDRRHDKAREAADLQAQMDGLARLRQREIELQERVAASAASQEGLSRAWEDRVERAGLAGMPLTNIRQWRQEREFVLRAAAAVEEAKEAMEGLERTAKEAQAALGAALQASGIAIESGESLETLIVAASEAVDDMERVKVRAEELRKQRLAAKAAIANLEDRVTRARGAVNGWKASWRQSAVRAGLPEEVDVGTAEGALTLFASIEKELSAIRELRKTRIETMRKDLAVFVAEARALAQALAPDLTGESAVTIATRLGERLEKAKADHRDAERLSNEIRSSTGQLESAAANAERAMSAVQPLLHLANASTIDELRAAITRSDRWRTLSTAMESARVRLRDDSDGLSRDAVTAERLGTDVSEIPAAYADITRELEVLTSQQNELSAQLANAQAALAKISGQNDAARAEAQRQEALAKMAGAAERYIKVFTAGRLLRWAIDRYRETKQGPMLARAGEVFSMLTLGRFKGLAVDYESEPPVLEGERPEGTVVGVADMSDGTRDQLYAALRVAALELHLTQAQPFPFIADDLFINYDDARAQAGLEVLGELSERTQVIFLSHHEHLVASVKAVFGTSVNMVRL